MKRTYEIPKQALILASISLIAAAMIVPAIAGQDEPKVQAEPILQKGSETTIMIAYADQTVFVPDTISINVGDTLVFLNQDGFTGRIGHYNCS